MGDVLFHHRGVDGDVIEILALHRSRRVSRPRSSGSASIPHLPRRSACASGSTTRDQAADDAERTSRRRNVASTGSRPTAPRPPRPRAHRHVEGKAGQRPGASSVAGRPVWDGKNPAHSRSNTSQSIRAASFTSSWRMSIISTRRARRRSSCSGRRFSRLHFTARNCKVSAGRLQNPAPHDQQNRAVIKKNQTDRSCSGKTT